MWLYVSKLLGYLAAPFSLTVSLLILALLAWLVRAKRLSRFCLITGVVVLVVCSTPLTSNWVRFSLENQYPPVAIHASPEANLIVVLGGVLAKPVKPRLEAELVDSSDRILHAFRLYKAGKAPAIFLSAGGIGVTGDEKYEAFYIAQLLMEWGLPESAIIQSNQSRTTRENALETAEYLAQKNSLHEPVLLVTSALHMPRAVRTFEKAGVTVIPSVTDVSAGKPIYPSIVYWLPSLGALNSFTKAWHEYLGLWVYRFRGWV